MLKNQSQRLSGIRQERKAKLEVQKAHGSELNSGLVQGSQSADAMEIYRKVRDCARSLHNALSRGWQCKCAAPHHANLRLEACRPAREEASKDLQRNGSPNGSGGHQDIRFKFLFSYAADQMEKSVGQNTEQPLHWREAEIAPFICDSESASSHDLSCPIDGAGPTPKSALQTDLSLQPGSSTLVGQKP